MFPALAVLALAVVACGGGGGSSPVLPKGGSTPASRVQVQLKIAVPSAPSNASPRIKRRMAEAQNTNGFRIIVYPVPQGTSTPLYSADIDVSATSANCLPPNAADLSRTCQVQLNFTPATYNFVMSSYDLAPVSGAIPGTAHELGYEALTQAVTLGTANNINVSLNGLAAAVSVTLPIPVVHTLDALTQQATVAVLDADNNVIVANGYVDALGNAVTVSLASNCPLFTVTPATFATPLPSGATVAYNPAGITAAEMTGGSTATISATLSTGPSGSANATVPAATQTVNIHAPAVGITVQSASSLWVAEPIGYLQNVTLTPPVAAQSPDPVATVSGIVGSSPHPNDILYNSGDGNLYFTMSNNPALGRLPTSGAQFLETGIALSANALSLATDGTNIWTVEPSSNMIALTPWSTFSSAQEATATAGAGLQQIVAGTGGSMWYTEGSLGNVGTAASPTPGPGWSQLPLPSGAGPQAIAWDGNTTMYVAESSASKIAVISGPIASATVVEYSTGAAVPTYIAFGPDGNAWFDFTVPFAGIGRITPAGSVSLFPLPVGSTPGQMASANNLVWVVDTANPSIYGISP